MIQYRLAFSIVDSDGSVPLYADVAELDVKTLVSVVDRLAFDTLADILRSQLLADGSTVLELREIARATEDVQPTFGHRPVETL